MATAIQTDIEGLESLDFEHVPPCEHSQHNEKPYHSGPGYYLIRVHAPCGHCDNTIYICKSGYEQQQILMCRICWHRHFKDEAWTVLGTVG